MTHPSLAGNGRSATRAAPLVATLAAVIAAAAAVWSAVRLDGVERRLERATDQLAELTEVAKLLRLEGASEGRGIAAIIEQIDFWAPQLAAAATPPAATGRIRSTLDDSLDAVGALGESAWQPLITELETPGVRDDEARKWLLRAALRANPQQAEALLAGVLRGTRLAPSARLRFFAADELLERNRAFAGEVLAQILSIESAKGVTRDVPPEFAPEYERVIGTNQFPEFFNLIERFVRSRHPDVAAVLQMILGRPEHDLITLQTCVRELGKLGARDALPRIRELYSKPPRGMTSPLFATTCLQAIADLEGAAACDWFREQLSVVDVPVISTKLQDLVKQHCH